MRRLIDKKILTFSDVAFAIILGICSFLSDALFRLIITVILALGLFALKRFVEEMG